MDAASPEPAGSLQRDYSQCLPTINLGVATSRKEGARRALAALDAATRASNPEAAKEIASHLLDQCTGGKSLPPLITGFLETRARSYLEHLYIVEGEPSAKWRNARECVEKLVWSLLPKQDKESRRRLFTLLPELFQWLHTLLKSQQVTVQEEDAFFAELAQLHAAALNAQTPSVAASPAGESIRFAADTKPIERHCETTAMSTETDKKNTQLPQEPRSEQAPDATSSGSDLLSNIRIGTWVEFANERATKRVMRVEWMSRQGSVFVFQDPRTDSSLCVTAERLDQRLRERSACTLK